MRAIFVSYRRGDSEGEAGRLFDDLVRQFSEDSVFMDVAAIEAGRDFRKVIDESVSTCGVLLAMIGPDWINARDASDHRRLDDPSDFVRLETASALKRDIPVIPVLVRGATMPRADQLPDDLKDLAYRNAVELTHARWSSDLPLLIKALRPHVGQSNTAPNTQGPTAAVRTPSATIGSTAPSVGVGIAPAPPRRPMPMILGAVAAVLVIGVAAAYVMMPQKKPQPVAMVEIPKVVGKSLDAAKQELEDHQLTSGTVSTDTGSDKPRDTVLEEFPGAGQQVMPGSKVDLKVAAGKALADKPATEQKAISERTASDLAAVRAASSRPLSLPCQIPASSSDWSLPGSAEVLIDNTSVGAFAFGHTGSTALSFPCTTGPHTFKFLLTVQGRSMSCSGPTHFSAGARLSAQIQIQAWQPKVCGLTEE